MLITTYFEQWQRHSPVLHPSLFDPNTVSFPLLVNVLLVGALYSSDERRVSTARMLIPVAEKWVLSSRIFNKQRTSSHVRKMLNSLSSEEILSDLETLQAAFIMFKILLREGDTKKIYEVRTTMFDCIIIVTYILNIRNRVATRLTIWHRPLEQCLLLTSRALLKILMFCHWTAANGKNSV